MQYFINSFTLRIFIKKKTQHNNKEKTDEKDGWEEKIIKNIYLSYIPTIS